MRSYYLKITAWWQHLGEREQKAALLGSITVALFLIYECIWLPLDAHVEQLRQKINAQEKSLAELNAIDSQLSNHASTLAAKKESFSSPADLLSAIQQDLDVSELSTTITGLKQSSNELFELHLQNASFDVFIQLLLNMQRKYDITIDHLNVTALKSPGLVNVDLTFKATFV